MSDVRDSWSGGDLYHGVQWAVEVHDDEDHPHLHLFVGDNQLVIAPARDLLDGNVVETGHVAFARSLAEGAYSYLELLTRKHIEASHRVP